VWIPHCLDKFNHFLGPLTDVDFFGAFNDSEAYRLG
jgi:hypothetical protein